MEQKHEERLLELYEKGVLTKEEARACFKELNNGQDLFFVEDKPKLTFSLPNLRIFSSTKHKQEYSFEGIESLFLTLSEGKISFNKSKSDQLVVKISYNQEINQTQFPQLYVENKGLYFSSILPCQLVVSLPQVWMSVLDLELGKADARLDYLPFEDISIHSKTDKKQQDIRLATNSDYSQHLFLQLTQAPIHIDVPKKQGVKARVESIVGQVVVNKKKKISPYFCEKSGQQILYVKL